MNEEIKFKAWDQWNEGFLYSDSYKSLSNFFKAVEMLEEGENNITLCQYSGFKDAPQHIFDGDIVFVPEVDKTYFVRLENGCFFLYHTKFFNDNGHSKWGTMFRAAELNFTMKVVGSIHSNPELLKP